MRANDLIQSKIAIIFITTLFQLKKIVIINKLNIIKENLKKLLYKLTSSPFD